MKLRTIFQTTSPAPLSGVVPGVQGQRAFPIRAFRGIDPFVMLDHIGPQQVGTDYYLDASGHAHPHRGFETITFMFEGGMAHVDSLGNQAQLDSGSVQRMNAGKGIIHGGDMWADPVTGIFNEIQLWVNLPADQKFSTPDIHNVPASDIPEVHHHNATIRVIGGELLGVKGPIQTLTPTKTAHIIANGPSMLLLDQLPASYNVGIYLIKGTVNLGDRVAAAHELIEFNRDGDSIQLEIAAQSELLLLAGIPLEEPVVMGGPFVMNSQAQIDQAYADFRAGTFGTVPTT